VALEWIQFGTTVGIVSPTGDNAALLAPAQPAVATALDAMVTQAQAVVTSIDATCDTAYRALTGDLMVLWRQAEEALLISTIEMVTTAPAAGSASANYTLSEAQRTALVALAHRTQDTASAVWPAAARAQVSGAELIQLHGAQTEAHTALTVATTGRDNYVGRLADERAAAVAAHAQQQAAFRTAQEATRAALAAAGEGAHRELASVQERRAAAETESADRQRIIDSLRAQVAAEQAKADTAAREAADAQQRMHDAQKSEEDARVALADEQRHGNSTLSDLRQKANTSLHNMSTAHAAEIDKLKYELQKAGTMLASRPVSSMGGLVRPCDVLSPKINGNPWYEAAGHRVGWRPGIIWMFVPPAESQRTTAEAWLVRAFGLRERDAGRAQRPREQQEQFQLSLSYAFSCAVLSVALGADADEELSDAALAHTSLDRATAVALTRIGSGLKALARERNGSVMDNAALARPHGFQPQSHAGALEPPPAMRTAGHLMASMTAYKVHVAAAVMEANKAGGNPWLEMEAERMESAFDSLLTDIAKCGKDHRRIHMADAGAGVGNLATVTEAVHDGWKGFRSDVVEALSELSVTSSVQTSNLALRSGGVQLRAQQGGTLGAKRTRPEDGNSA
jgi:hypothetical protein